MPGTGRATSTTSREARRRSLRALEAAGRDPADFSFAGQLRAAPPRTAPRGARTALGVRRRRRDARDPRRAGDVAPEDLALVADEVAEPLAERSTADTLWA